MSTRTPVNQRGPCRRSIQSRGTRPRNANRAYARECVKLGLSTISGPIPPALYGGPRDSAPWLRKMGRACGFMSGRDSSAERRIRRMIANAIQIETARLANLCDEDARA
jgi:hypothetical protein